MALKLQNESVPWLVLVVLVPVALWSGRFIAVDTSSAAGYFILLPLLLAFSVPFLIFGGADATQRSYAVRLFVFALLLRVALAAVTTAFIDPNAVAPDQVRYHYAGTFLAQEWHGEIEGPPSWFMNPGNLYYIFVGSIYYVFGSSMLLPKLVNAVAGALAVVGLFRIAGRIATQRAALLAGVFAALCPSLTLWSALAIRDALVVLGLVLCFDAVLDWSERKRLSAWLMLAFGVFLVATLRDYLANILLASLALAAIAGQGKVISPRRFLVSISILVLLVIVLREMGIVEPLVEQVSLEGLESARQKLAIGGSAFGAGSSVGSLGSALLHLPIGIAYFLLAPFPWSVESNLQFAALPEVFLWYGLVPFVIIGIKRAFEQHATRLASLFMFVTTVTLTYSLVEGNVGTAYRHRAQVLIFFLAFAGIGVDVFMERRARSRSRGSLTQPAALQ
ncbi:MAG: glycosyltransferase family 39 protein [Chrysiogenetes bacterium]|nr:glycosyltransferase family 39 protein [Chrysiogenetes bacterium]